MSYGWDEELLAKPSARRKKRRRKPPSVLGECKSGDIVVCLIGSRYRMIKVMRPLNLFVMCREIRDGKLRQFAGDIIFADKDVEIRCVHLVS